MKRYLSYAKLLANLLTEKSAAVLFTQQLSNSATQQLSNSATQQLSNSATQQLSNSATQANASSVLIRYLLLFSFSSVTTGCYLSAKIYSLDPASSGGSPVFKVDNPGGSEFVSGSNQYETTQIRRYQIMSSSGNYNRELKLKTPKGYSLYSSVQGALISGQEGVR